MMTEVRMRDRGVRILGGRIGAFVLAIPKGPCTQRVYTLALKYLYRDYT